MKSATGALRRRFMQNNLRRAIDSNGNINPDIESNVIEWTTLFRRNWDIYAEFALGIKLKPFQRHALHLLGISDVFFWRASRGTAKTFITALAAIIKMLLYPNSWVVVTASTADQANKIVEDKIIAELILKISPLLRYYYEQEWLVITKPTDCYVIKCTLNGSTLKVLAPTPSAKGSRSTFTIYDEVAIMKKGDIDDIFDGMLFPRQAAYLSDPKYGKNRRWVEESKAIYLTSSFYSFMWWYKTWKDCVSGYYMDKRTKYNVEASDFFVSIENNLKTWGDYRRAKKINGDIEFRMNYLNEAVGNSEDAFFSLESLKKAQILTKCYRPPTAVDLILGNEIENVKKKENEIRVIAADFAWTETKTATNESDNSVAFCISGIWKKDHFEKHIDYIEMLPTADDADGCANRLKELRSLYQADYILPDARSGGEAIVNSLSKPYDGAYGTHISPFGLTIADESKYQVAPNDKLDYYRSKAVDKNAIHCVIPIIGTSALNTAYWRSMKRALERGYVKLLIGLNDQENKLIDNGEYYKLSPEQLADALGPYGQTDMLVHEAVNLRTEIRNDQIKLEAPRGGHRDRAVTCAMGLLIFDYIENEWLRQQNDEQDEDLENIQLVW